MDKMKKRNKSEVEKNDNGDSSAPIKNTRKRTRATNVLTSSNHKIGKDGSVSFIKPGKKRLNVKNVNKLIERLPSKQVKEDDLMNVIEAEEEMGNDHKEQETDLESEDENFNGQQKLNADNLIERLPSKQVKEDDLMNVIEAEEEIGNDEQNELKEKGLPKDENFNLINLLIQKLDQQDQMIKQEMSSMKNEIDRKFDSFNLKIDELQVKVNEKSTPISTSTQQNYEDGYVTLVRGDKWVTLVQTEDDKLMIGKELLDRAKKKNSISIFISKTFSRFCQVSDIYRATYSGRDDNKVKKIAFSKEIEEQMVLAAKLHIPNKTEQEYKEAIKFCITNKCSCWNALFDDLKKGLEFSDSLATKHKLNKDDIKILRNFKFFKEDPSKFEHLDFLIDKNTDQTQSDQNQSDQNQLDQNQLDQNQSDQNQSDQNQLDQNQLDQTQLNQKKLDQKKLNLSKKAADSNSIDKSKKVKSNKKKIDAKKMRKKNIVKDLKFKKMVEAYLLKCEETETDTEDDNLSLHDSNTSIGSSIQNPDDEDDDLD